MKDERDEVVEKVLAALGRVEVPEGLAARVAEGLERRAAVRVVEFGWREMLAGSGVAGVWWRGALVGAAASMLVVGVVMLAGHLVRGHGVESAVRVVAPAVGAGSGGVVGVAAREERREPCAVVGGRQVDGGAGSSSGGAWRGEMMRVESVAPSRPFVELPLTAQERALVHMVQAGDAKELAMLNPEVRERQQAEEAAQFQRFFAERPPSKPVPAETNAAETTSESVVGGPGLATRDGDASVEEPALAESSTEPVAGENR